MIEELKIDDSKGVSEGFSHIRNHPFRHYHIPNLRFAFVDVDAYDRFDAEEWVRGDLEKKGWQVKRTHRQNDEFSNTGKPDFFCFKEPNLEYFIEVKTGNDGLRQTQMRWISLHPNCKVIVVHVNQRSVYYQDDRVKRIRDIGKIDMIEQIRAFRSSVKNEK